MPNWQTVCFHQSADYKCISFGIIQPILVTMKVEYKPVPEGGQRIQPCKLHFVYEDT